jgi:hypothetical protein
MKPISGEPRDEALRLADQAELWRVTAELGVDLSAWEAARSDPRSFLESRGIRIPDGITVRPLPKPQFGMPAPDWEPFTLRLTNCRTIVYIDDSGKKTTEEVCLGWEIIPHPLPGGPIG